jgi:phage-related tail protein
VITFPLSVVISATDRWTAPLAKMQASVKKTFAPLREVGTKLGALSEASGLNKVVEGFQGVARAGSELVHSLASGFLKVGAILAGVGFALYEVVGGTARAGVNAVRAAGRIGLTVEKYQELAYAARAAGLETEDFDASMAKFSRTIGQVALRNKAANEGFRRLGINVFDADHRLRPIDELLGEVADRLNQLDDPLKRAAISSLLFGRQGSRLTEFLKGGAAGFAKMGAEAHELGVVLSKEDAEASKEFVHSWHQVEEALTGARNVIGVALLPAFQELAVKLRDFLVGHRAELSEWARKFARDLPAAVDKLVRVMGELLDALEPLVKAFAWLVDTVGPVPVLLGAIGTVLAVTVVPAVLSSVAALYTLSAALVGTPAGWVVLAITAVVLAIGLLIVDVLLLASQWKFIWQAMRIEFDVFKFYLKGAVWQLLAPVRWIEDEWSKLPGFFSNLWAEIKDAIPGWAFAPLKLAGEVAVGPARLTDSLVRRAQGGATVTPVPGSTHVKVEFQNLPKGARVSEAGNQGVDLDLSLGYSNLDGF